MIMKLPTQAKPINRQPSLTKANPKAHPSGDCCDVSVTAHCDDGTFSRGYAYGALDPLYDNCENCIDEAYRDAAAVCGGIDRVLSYRDFGGKVIGNNCPYPCPD